MHATRTVSTEDIIAAYQATGSVWKAGKRVGLSGQSVHGRLRAVGYKLANSKWTDEEVDELRSLARHATLGEIAERLGRTYAGVACKLNELGVSIERGRAKVKIPRGAGYDKASLRRVMRALDTNPAMPITRYARANGLVVETLVQAIEKHDPEWWRRYRRAHSDLPEKTCTGCGGVFIPSNGKQVYCTRRCGYQHRVDRDYFGGQRSNTIGLAEGRCQVCGKQPKKGLSSHHMFGKENDPENLSLVALCAGCHMIITKLGARDWTGQQWESLITFAWLRRHGPDVAKGELDDGGLYVCVEIEWEPEDEEEAS